MSGADDTERSLRIMLMQADLSLKQKQAFWETPRNLAIMAGALVAIVATVAGLAGYRAGQTSMTPQTIIIQQPAPAR